VRINHLVKKNGDKKMNTRKKLIAGLMAAMVIGTIGAVFATAQTDGTTPDITTQKMFKHPRPK
jgi:hypothetical protein